MMVRWTIQEQTLPAMLWGVIGGIGTTVWPNQFGIGIIVWPNQFGIGITVWPNQFLLTVVAPTGLLS